MLAVTTAEKTSTRWLSSLWNSLEGARVSTVNILDLWVIYLFVKVIVVNRRSTRVRKHFWEKSGCKSLSLKPSQIPRVTSQRGGRLGWSGCCKFRPLFLFFYGSSWNKSGSEWVQMAGSEIATVGLVPKDRGAKKPGWDQSGCWCNSLIWLRIQQCFSWN